MAAFDDFQKLDIRAGKIVSVEDWAVHIRVFDFRSFR